MTTQLYESSGMYATARVITEQVLDRMAPLGESAPGRIRLLNSLANAWEQNRNLLKAVAYLEKAAAASEKAPETQPQESGPVLVVRPMVRGSQWFSSGGGFVGSGLASIYMQMARIYRRLGRPDSVNQVLGKLRAHGPEGASALASIYQSEGRWDDAAAVYRSRVDSLAKDPVQAGYALLTLANLYQQQERYTDATAVLQQSISNLEAAGVQNPQVSVVQRQLAQTMAQAGQTEAADRIYQRLLADQGSPDWAQSLSAYASHLSDTQRGAQAESLLKGYLQNHADLPADQQSSYLYMLANIARQGGSDERADEYVRLALQKQTSANLNASPPEQNAIQKYTTLAQGAIGRDGEAAFNYALKMLDTASRGGPEREQVISQVISIASQFVSVNEPAKGEQLYQRLFATVGAWSADTTQPGLLAAQNYVQFLMSQENRRNEVVGAIERYRNLLITARGEGTGWQEEALRMTIQLEDARGALARTVIAGQDLVALEESLSGSTSEPYLNALETLAGAYQAVGNMEQALALRRQAIGISDLVSTGNDTHRVATRIETAELLAQLDQLDEAKTMATEALAIVQTMRPPQVPQFRSRVEQVLKLQKR
jgi:tetratricopeptide (TPR) repeat protein